jgi:hypothetical protein
MLECTMLQDGGGMFINFLSSIFLYNWCKHTSSVAVGHQVEVSGSDHILHKKKSRPVDIVF